MFESIRRAPRPVQAVALLGTLGAAVSLGSLLFTPAKRRIATVPEPTLKAKLAGKNILIVGGTAGIGRALASSLLNRNANVTVVGRRQPDGLLSACKFIQKDLSTLRNARSLADDVDLRSLDAVVFTNGIMPTAERVVNAEGIEIDMAVSAMSRYAFVTEFKDRMFGTKRTDTSTKPRVFVMGFPGVETEVDLTDINSERVYKPFVAHMNTVVVNEALVTYLTREMGSAVNVYGLNPGLIKTDLRKQYFGEGWLNNAVEGLVGMFYPSAEQYSERVLLTLLASEELEELGGKSFSPQGEVLEPNPFLTRNNNLEELLHAMAAMYAKALPAKTKK
ncbi:hypothetical protein HK101_010005 [Irineochytrium annulatum]|nr:hypothetical protein HK101_010005 [Irineochytrium annulatum]